MSKNLRRSLIIISITAFVLTTPSYALYEKYRGIMSDWHKAKICMPCHINTLPEKDAERFLRCTPCHNPQLNLRDQKQLEEIHDVDICIKCHVGSEYNKKNLGIRVHDPHYKLSCEKCHGDVGSKPDVNLCTDCHGSNPHEVHGRVLDEICVACHGEKIKDYLPPTEEKKVAAEKKAEEVKAEEKSIIQSISDLILNLLSFIF